ncbi:MAG: DNA mismatch repair protein MutS [Spirochaetaceae bacterium]|nr:DNA mismatch repair protein MutS [Spirochaetaceae bacterium]
MATKTTESPLIVQYRRIKRAHSSEILFFRLGDFYEMFANDAVEASTLLGLTLTSRNGLPMCGIPYHSARNYIARLLKHGKKIAICEQLGVPQKGKAIIERDVVEVITPGTTVDEDFLDKGDSNYLAALCTHGNSAAIAYIDLSTGQFEAFSFGKNDTEAALRSELERLQIKEIIVQESLLESGLGQTLRERNGLVVNRWMDWLFDTEKGFELLTRQFGTESLKGFGLENNAVEVRAAGALLEYVGDTAKALLPHIRKITIRRDGDFVGIDESSLRNLELLRSLQGGGVQFSLLETMDETKTAMGRRLLKQRLTHPLCCIDTLHARLNFVEAFYHAQGALSTLRELLGRTGDLERQCSRLAMQKSHGKDLVALKNALIQYSEVLVLLQQNYTPTTLPFRYEAEEARSLNDTAQAALEKLRSLLGSALLDEPSILLTEGKLIRGGYNVELDKLHELRDNGRALLEAYLEEEREKTGISSLKIRYNRIIGYFFEVTKIHLAKIPPHFIRRQGIVGGERFTTDQLAALESDINGAQDKIISLEKKLFLELREKAAELVPELTGAARRLAELDVAQALATAATLHGWIRPVIDNENRLEILEGRHPVVEAQLPRGEFIPNDTMLNAQEGTAFALITGPNMAGKSTYLRQSALIAVMAQMGSFVPARDARIGIIDRVYCRVGAQDNLARGESTFLVEMNETAFILNTATERSLVIMDEVGRGTGTFDGLSIAQAVSEALLNRIRCRTLFATHYHELAEMTNPRLAQRSMQVEEINGTIVFRRRLVEGPAEESYGLHVARLAGLDEQVIARAEEIMRELKQGSAAGGEGQSISCRAAPLDQQTRTKTKKSATAPIQVPEKQPPQELTPGLFD